MCWPRLWPQIWSQVAFVGADLATMKLVSKQLSKQTIYIAPKSKRIRAQLRGSLGGNVKSCLEETCFEMLFKCGKDFWVTSGIVKGIPDSWCTYTERKAQELKANFIWGTVRRWAEVERRSLDRRYGVRRSDRYDGVPEDRILRVSVASLNLMRHFTRSQWNSWRRSLEDKVGGRF